MTKKYETFDIKIKRYGVNIGFCDPYLKRIYIKGLRNIIDYVTFSIEVINHEYMHILLQNEIDSNTSYLYDSDICLIIEDRKLLTAKFIDAYNHDKK